MEIFSPNIIPYKEKIDTLLAKSLSFFFLIVTIILSFTYYFESAESFIAILACFIVALLNLYIFHKTKNTKVVFVTICLTGILSLCYALVFLEKNFHFADQLWMLAFILISFINLGFGFGLILTLFSLTSLFIYTFYSMNANINNLETYNIYQKFALYFEIITAIALNFYLIFIYSNLFRFVNLNLQKTNHQLKKSNQEAILQINENTTLLKEIHTRVKNNLHIIINLLKNQQSEINEEKSVNQFKNTINRVKSMSLIHDKLYQVNQDKFLLFSDYLNELIESIQHSFSQNVIFSCKCEIEELNLDTMIPLGLIINELATNSFKHAFDNEKNNEIKIMVTKVQDNLLQITYSDNGTWKENSSVQGFGNELIHSLIDQLDGDLQVNKNDNGTTFHIQIKYLN